MFDRPLAAFAAATLLLSMAAQAGDEDDFGRSPIDCINVQQIDKTHIIDDQTVLFFMRGSKQIFRNDLPRRCPNLESEDAFRYSATSRRLCHIDTITVVPRSMAAAITCKLGKFQPITAKEADELLAIDRQAQRGDRVAKPVEPPKQLAPAGAGATEPKSAEPAQQ